MSREHHWFICEGAMLAATIDGAEGAAASTTGLLIVSGGNEIRAGAHGGMASLAQKLAQQGFAVCRYDRRGIGDSAGENSEFLNSAADIAAAAAFFRQRQPKLQRIIALGNCDAATALVLFGPSAAIDGYILANPWVIDAPCGSPEQPPTMPPSAIRARYWDRIKDPRTLLDLMSGKIDLRKLFAGLQQARQKQENSQLALQMRDALLKLDAPVRCLLADRDTTARAFLAAWQSDDFAEVRKAAHISIAHLDSASHSFADDIAKLWLTDQIIAMLRAT